MATPVFCCGWECGSGTGTHHWTSANTPTADTVTFRTGLRAGRCDPSSSTEYFFVTLASVTRWVGRFYIRFATLPSADTSLCEVGNGGQDSPCVRFKQSDSKIYAGVHTTLGASGVAVTTGVWYRIDFDFNVQTGGNDTCDVQVDGSACGQATATGLSAAETRVNLGVIDTCTADVYLDDFLLSNTAADYPLGAGHVNSYIPNADGTHTANSANEVERTLTGTDIVIATTTAYQLIDERPLPTTEVDFINWKTNGGTDYVEWQYEDSTEGAAPRAVEAILVYHDASGAGTHNFQVTLREHAGATTADIAPAATRNVGATISYIRKHFATVPGTSDAWTETKFNALRSRLLVSDASPDVYIDAAMLEAEWAEAGGATGTIAATLQKATAALTGEQPESGSIAVTAQKATASLTGVMQPSGAIAATLQAALAALSGTQTQSGAIAATAQMATASLVGTQTQTGTVSATLQAALAALVGTMEPAGVIAGTLQPATASLAGTQEQSGAIAASLQPATASLTGVMQPSGAIAATLQAASAALAGTHEQTGTIAATLMAATAALAGEQTSETTGAIAASLQMATASLTGTQEQSGALAATLTMATASLAGVMEASGSVAASLQPATASLAGEQSGAAPEGTIAGTLQPASAALTGTQTQTGSIAASLQPPTASLTGEQSQTGSIDASLQPATAALTAEQQFLGTIAATLQAATGSLAGTQGQTGQIAATLQLVTAALFGSQTVTGSIAATLQAATASASARPLVFKLGSATYIARLTANGTYIARVSGDATHIARVTGRATEIERLSGEAAYIARITGRGTNG